jgi:hypothetical protein
MLSALRVIGSATLLAAATGIVGFRQLVGTAPHAPITA